MSEKLTIKDIAQIAGVSKTTVSFYLNGKTDKMSQETQERIAKVIAETNYHPSIAARSLNSKSSKLIGVLIGDITNSFANQIVKGIEDYAKDKKYQLIVGSTNYEFENEQQYVHRMLAMGVDGFIVQPSSGFHLLLEEIKQAGKTVVFIDSQTKLGHEKWVKTNNYEVVLEVSNQLAQCDYDEFLLISADPGILSTRKERVSGFIDGLAMNDKTCTTLIVDGDIDSEEMRGLIEQNLQFGKSTLIFVSNCFLLPRVFVALKNYRNLIPDSIGLIGYDNTEWTNFSVPSITTIVQPAQQEGYQSAKILIDTIEEVHEELPNQILSCYINCNESIKPLKNMEQITLKEQPIYE